jgi:hypothetical protein
VLELRRDVVAKLLDDRSATALGFLCEVNHALIAALHATETGVEWLVPPGRTVDRRRLVEKIRASVIGDDAVLEGLSGGAGSSTPTTRPRAAH